MRALGPEEVAHTDANACAVRMCPPLQAQGFNTDGMNMGGFGGFGGFDPKQFDNSMKRGKAKGRKARSKQRKEDSARRRKERRRARRERARAAAQEDEVDEHIEL